MDWIERRSLDIDASIGGSYETSKPSFGRSCSMAENTRPPDGPTDMPGTRAEAKRRVLLESLDRGWTLIRLDARRPGVHVPDQFSNEFGLALKLSWRFANTDLVINERGVAATLRFGGVPSRCIVPWSAIWGIVPAGQDGTKAWPADLPPELDGPEQHETDEVPEPVEPVRPKLQVVRPVSAVKEAPLSEPTPVEAPIPPPPDDGGGKPRAPWLRLVR
jgi:stringent starvation protein B